MKSLSRVQLFATPWTVAHQAPQFMECSRQEYWSGLPFPSPGHLPNPGIEPGSPALQADTLRSEPPGCSLWGCKKSGMTECLNNNGSKSPTYEPSSCRLSKDANMYASPCMAADVLYYCIFQGTVL